MRSFVIAFGVRIFLDSLNEECLTYEYRTKETHYTSIFASK